MTGRLPSDDSYIDANKSNTVFGSENKIQVRPDKGADRRGLIRFDLSDIPSDATITGARLYLYEKSTKADQVTYLYRITQYWTEGAVTWFLPWSSAGGDFDGSTAYALYIPDQRNCSISLDITTLVQLWVNNIYPNYGVLLYAEGPNHIIEYASKEEANNPDWAPKLDITYVVNVKQEKQPPEFFHILLAWLMDFLNG